ncbi:hypothetical protein [Prosthecobacter sp.]|uniref:hypothetical protein n=1 Tax=Prosthecobacter sp. TaxID=1965333 RepID=UPI0037852AB9
MKNYRTTIAGALLAAVSSVALYQNNGGNLSDWKLWIIPALIAFLSYLAKDAGVSGTMKAMPFTLALFSLFTLASCADPQTPAEALKRQRELAIADKLLTLGTTRGILTPDEAATIRDVGTLAVPTNPPAAIEVTSGK